MANSRLSTSLVINGTQEITGIETYVTDNDYVLATSAAIKAFVDDFLPPKPTVGGIIFYIDSTADGTYTFYDENGDETSAPNVGDNYLGYTYEVEGATKDKYYVFDPNFIDYQMMFPWGYEGIRTDATSNIIGSGKTNTETILSIEPPQEDYRTGSIWILLQEDINASYYNGCDDWYIGSIAEYVELINSGLIDEPESLQQTWTSVEYEESVTDDGAYYIDSGSMPTGEPDGKSQAKLLIPIRSF